MDDTLYSLVDYVLPLYTKQYNDNIKIEDLKEYKIHKFLKPECENIFKEFLHEDVFESIKISDEVIDTIEYLNEFVDIYYPSAGHIKTREWRVNLLKRNIPSFQSDQLILTKEKWKLDWLDVLVDDCLDNFIGFKGYRIVKDRPWNSNGSCYFDYDFRVYNFNDV